MTRSGRPWALFLPYLLPWRLPGLPPFGPGLAPRHDLVGRLRDAVMTRLVHGVIDRNLPALNAVRARVGLAPLEHMADLGRAAGRLVGAALEAFAGDDVLVVATSRGLPRAVERPGGALPAAGRDPPPRGGRRLPREEWASRRRRSRPACPSASCRSAATSSRWRATSRSPTPGRGSPRRS